METIQLLPVLSHALQLFPMEILFQSSAWLIVLMVIGVISMQIYASESVTGLLYIMLIIELVIARPYVHWEPLVWTQVQLIQSHLVNKNALLILSPEIPIVYAYLIVGLAFMEIQSQENVFPVHLIVHKDTLLTRYLIFVFYHRAARQLV